MSADPFSRELLSKVKRARRLSFLILLWEELSLRLWRMVSWVAGFLTLSLLDIPAYFSALAPTYVFWVFVIGLVYWLYVDVLHFRWPTRGCIDRRIEEFKAARAELRSLTDACRGDDNSYCAILDRLNGDDVIV